MQLKVSIAEQIFKNLSSLGFYENKNLDSQFVLAYSFYWWDAFAKGYIFEAWKQKVKMQQERGILNA